MSEDWADANTPYVEDEHIMDLEGMVVECFKLKDYFYAFLLDAIIYENYTIHKHSKRLVTHLQTLDDDYCDVFAGRYDLDVNRVKRASTYLTRMQRTAMNERLETVPKELEKRMVLWGLLNANRTA